MSAHFMAGETETRTSERSCSRPHDWKEAELGRKPRFACVPSGAGRQTWMLGLTGEDQLGGKRLGSRRLVCEFVCPSLCPEMVTSWRKIRG